MFYSAVLGQIFVFYKIIMHFKRGYQWFKGGTSRDSVGFLYYSKSDVRFLFKLFTYL